MFLKKLKLKNYRLFTDIEVSFQQGMNVLIGKNSSGKSSLLEAIDFLLNQIPPAPLEEIIPYDKQSQKNIQVIIEGVLEMSTIEKNIFSSLLKDKEEIDIFNKSHLEIVYSKTIVKDGNGYRVLPNIQIDARGTLSTSYPNLIQQIAGYFFPKIQTNNILKILDREKEVFQQPMIPLGQLEQMLLQQPSLINQYVRNLFYKSKQEKPAVYEKIKDVIINAYPEMIDLDIEFDPNRAQVQIFFINKKTGIKKPLESEGLGIREYLYTLLILYYFPDTIIIKDEALVHMHKSLINNFIASIGELHYQMITTSHIKELIKTLDFGNIIICKKSKNNGSIVKNLMQEEEMESVLDELGYSIETNTEMNDFLNS